MIHLQGFGGTCFKSSDAPPAEWNGLNNINFEMNLSIMQINLDNSLPLKNRLSHFYPLPPHQTHYQKYLGMPYSIFVELIFRWFSSTLLCNFTVALKCYRIIRQLSCWFNMYIRTKKIIAKTSIMDPWINSECDVYVTWFHLYNFKNVKTPMEECYF